MYLFFGGKIVYNVEELADFLRRLALDHVCDGFASDIAGGVGYVVIKRNDHSQERLDVEVVGSENDLEQHLLVDGDELLIPFTDVGRALACLVLTLVRVRTGKRLSAMMFAVFQDLTGR